ncbi:MAG: hypothetical protein WBH86_03990 [Thermogutta sp.]|jgi:hypothetical protein|nr:hypothetical protein [Thermogutta sp.]HPU06642.1 hypothetical protein [Thermogutta sp.]
MKLLGISAWTLMIWTNVRKSRVKTLVAWMTAALRAERISIANLDK